MNERKAAFLAKLEVILEQRVVLVVKVSSLSAQEVFSVRERLWDFGGNFNFVKNSLARIAVENSSLSFLSEYLSKSVAFVHCGKNVPEFLRCIFKFSAEYGKDRLEILGGKYDKVLFDRRLMDEFSKLPDEMHVYLSLINAINAVPIALVNSLDGPARLLAGYFDSYVKSANVNC
ncbi:50S ribosomal protein L10 [Neorickettsia risticii]|uniref:Large ribosomal subunit protein uL10 n=1 Tax=Neorickettsia risticii (strain Illinois) TaxID=434131 RepID=C6V5G6_NEORI|nr:50S ribosomal protein L10 [Neorickettsia risticii]ACT69626.1 50S ribosomal protein L10 [Neorickettsia risticii str. Illinois]